MAEFRLKQAVFQRAVVGKQEKSFAIGVQAAGGVDTGDGNEIGQRGAGRNGAVRKLREDAVGLMEENVSHGRKKGGADAALLPG
jgi:hypothetical protein